MPGAHELPVSLEGGSAERPGQADITGMAERSARGVADALLQPRSLPLQLSAPDLGLVSRPILSRPLSPIILLFLVEVLKNIVLPEG